MRKALPAAVLAASLAACGSLKVGPPALFPVATVWVVPLDDVLEGPLASDGFRVFAAHRQGAVRAFDPSGAPIWRRDGPPGVLAAATGVLVLRQADGTVASLEPETGATRWTSASGIAGTLPPVIDADVIFVAGDGLAGLDAATGRVLWSFPAPPKVTSLPTPQRPWVLDGEDDGTLRCRDRATGLSLWTYRTKGTLLAPAVVDDHGRVLLGTRDGRFLALEIQSGRLRWRWKVGADVTTGGAVLGDRVLFASFEDVLYALERRTGHMSWRAPLPSRPLSGPILVGDSVLVACYENDILGYDGRTGRRLGALKTPAEIRTPPLLVEDRLYVGLRDRTVVAYLLDMTASKPAAAPAAAPRAPQRRGGVP